MSEHYTRYCKEVRRKENEALSRSDSNKNANSISFDETTQLTKEIRKNTIYPTLSNNMLQGKIYKNPFYISVFLGDKSVK